MAFYLEGGRGNFEAMKRILIVDDEKSIRDFCQRILIKNDFITETAENAKEALEILDDTFDLVISDFSMPDFNGMWLARQIKDKFNGKIPVIIMTGTIDDVKIAEKESSGVDEFLLKPFETDSLLFIVSKYLKKVKD